MIVYFNNQGVMTTQLQHGDPAIRQGSTFTIDFLFDTDNPFIQDKIVGVRFKKSGEKQFGSEYLATKDDNTYIFNRIDSSENIYSLVDGKEYIHYTFTSTPELNLTNKFGELEACLVIYSQTEINNALFQPETVTKIYATGLVHLYVEKTFGEVPPDFNITPTQYAYLMSLMGSLIGKYNELDERIDNIEGGGASLPEPADSTKDYTFKYSEEDGEHWQRDDYKVNFVIREENINTTYTFNCTLPNNSDMINWMINFVNETLTDLELPITVTKIEDIIDLANQYKETLGVPIVCHLVNVMKCDMYSDGSVFIPYVLFAGDSDSYNWKISVYGISFTYEITVGSYSESIFNITSSNLVSIEIK